MMNVRKSFRPHVDGLPLSIPLAQSLRNLSRAHMQDQLPPALSVVATLPLRPASDANPTQLRLKIFDIDFYDRNPRLFENEALPEIRESLRAHGHWGIFLVTRRPGATRYIPAAGGNTTLRLLRELYEETGDERFVWLDCKVQPFLDEAKILGQHLSENLGRGGMRFWETACAVDGLLAELLRTRRMVDPHAPELSIREASEQLATLGIR